MAFIRTISEVEASGEVAELYAAELADDGYVANLTKAFSHRPGVYLAWRQLIGAIRQGMDPRRYELVTLAAARQLRSSYCALAHGKILADEHLAPETVRDIAKGGRADDLDAIDEAVMELAEQVVADATSIRESDIEELRRLGLSDAEIFDVIAAAAVRCFFSKTLDALGVQADVVFAELEPGLRQALTVGRPIAEA